MIFCYFQSSDFLHLLQVGSQNYGMYFIFLYFIYSQIWINPPLAWLPLLATLKKIDPKGRHWSQDRDAQSKSTKTFACKFGYLMYRLSIRACAK
jgi:ABC-type spermidine/putrescine transport system permease subunit I